MSGRHRVERVAGHLADANLQRKRHSVQGTPAFSNPRKFLLVQREGALDLKG